MWNGGNGPKICIFRCNNSPCAFGMPISKPIGLFKSLFLSFVDLLPFFACLYLLGTGIVLGPRFHQEYGPQADIKFMRTTTSEHAD